MTPLQRRRLTESPLQPGIWTGRRAFLFGGGPSFSQEDALRLSHEFSLGINMAFLRGPDVNLVYDHRLMCRLHRDPHWLNYPGIKVWLNYEIPNDGDALIQPLIEGFPGLIMLRDAKDPSRRHSVWSRSLSGGLYSGTHAGPAAINLADILGADPIYLLGFDYYGEGGRTTNWHDSYPEEWSQPAKKYSSFLQDFEYVRRNVSAKVVNLNPKSNLTDFPFGTLEEVLG